MAEEYTVVWNGSRDGPRGGLLLDYELPRERERRERKAAVGAGRALALHLLPAQARSGGRGPAGLGDLLELLTLPFCGR